MSSIKKRIPLRRNASKRRFLRFAALNLVALAIVLVFESRVSLNPSLDVWVVFFLAVPALFWVLVIRNLTVLLRKGSDSENTEPSKSAVGSELNPTEALLAQFGAVYRSLADHRTPVKGP